MSEHVLLIGAYGWQHSSWDETFYPDGLPDDWQLGYYGNEFRVVLIPAEYWQNPGLDVQQWLEETDQSPRFLSEWPQEREAQDRARRGMRDLSGRAVAFVMSLDHVPEPADIVIYKEMSMELPLIFDVVKLSATQQSSAQQTLDNALGKGSYGICWHGEEGGAGSLLTGPVALTRITRVSDARALRRIIEANLAACDGKRQVVLIIDGHPPDMQLMQNAGIILDLL